MSAVLVNLDKDDKITAKVEEAFEAGTCVTFVLPSGQKLIAFPAAGFERLHEVFQSPEFAESLAEGIEDFNAGRARFVASDAPKIPPR